MTDITERENKIEFEDAENEKPAGLVLARQEMLDLGNKVSEILVDRVKNLPAQDAWDGEFRKELDARLMESAPENGRSAEAVIDQAANEIMSIALRLAHPRCFGFVSSSPTWISVLADYLAAGFNNNVCTWLVASGPTHLELVVLDWVRGWLGYPESAGGLLTSGSSAATLEAFVAAREFAENPNQPTVYMSDQTHYSVIRAAKMIGIAPQCIRIVSTDDRFRLDIDELAKAVTEDQAAGFKPMIVAANGGTTSTGSIDPLNAIADLCESQNIWFHIDGAYGGFACVTEQGKQLMQGVERADSISLDAHKWFFQTYESAVLMVKDLRTLEDTFGMRPDILQDTVWGADHPNIANRGLQLSRTDRALKIWMSVQTFGMAKIRKHVANGMELAKRAEAYIDESAELELMCPVTLSAVCFRFNPSGSSLDEETIENTNRVILARAFWEDRAFFSSTLLRGVFTLRFCIINHDTTWNDVHETLEVIKTFGNEVLDPNH